MKDLQKLIEEKAANKLDADIIDYLNSMRDYQIHYSLSELNVIVGENKIPFNKFFRPSKNSLAFQIIYKNLLPAYIEKEAMEFMQKVDRLKNDVADLMRNTEC